MAVGFLHGVLPHGITKSHFINPTKIEVLLTDELLFPEQIRVKIEQAYNVKFSVTVTRNWDSLIAQTVATPGVDLIFLPSYWANSLEQQNLLSDISDSRKSLSKKIAADFITTVGHFYFVPLYWMKTGIINPADKSFNDFLKNKEEPLLYLLADEDLLLHHFQAWQQQGLLNLIAEKKILTLQLDQLNKELPTKGSYEASLQFDSKNEEEPPQLSALLIWGAVMPLNSQNKELVLQILDEMTNPNLHENQLLNTPFNTTLTALKKDHIPLNRRAEFIRNISLKDVLIIEQKEQNAKIILKDKFNFIL